MKYGVIIGRFQPYHSAHEDLLRFALTKTDAVIVCLGSSNTTPTIRNPFSFDERKKMILDSLDQDKASRVFFRPIHDYFYNENVWLAQVQNAVNDVISVRRSEVLLFGHLKDSSSYYLNSFPQWKFVYSGELRPINATQIREDYFSEKEGWMDNIPDSTYKFLIGYQYTDIKTMTQFSKFAAELAYYRSYKKQFVAPFPVQFNTVDAFIIKSGHVLLVRRGLLPGKGLYALPGGFLNPDENIVDGILREAVEETRISVSLPELRRAIKDIKYFDRPDRSLRGRTITHCALIDLGSTGDLPLIKGADDADKAIWYPLAELDEIENQLFDDHYSIAYYWKVRGH